MATITDPSKLPEWATGAADVVEPSAGKKGTGWVNGERPPPEYFNWWQELVHDWTEALNQYTRRLLKMLIGLALGNFEWKVLPDAYGANKPRYLNGVCYVPMDQTNYANEHGRIIAVGDDDGADSDIWVSIDGGTHFAEKANGTTNDLQAVCYVSASDRVVAVGNAGEILQSVDRGDAWLVKVSGTGNNLLACAGKNQYVVACGASGTITSSGDSGATWVVRVSGTAEVLYGCTASGTYFVVVGDNGTIIYSTVGTTWSAASGAGSIIYRDVAFGLDSAGAEMFVAVGEGSYAYSSNGTSWTTADLSAAPAAASLSSITFLRLDADVGGVGESSWGLWVACDSRNLYSTTDPTDAASWKIWPIPEPAAGNSPVLLRLRALRADVYPTTDAGAAGLVGVGISGVDEGVIGRTLSVDKVSEG